MGRTLRSRAAFLGDEGAGLAEVLGALKKTLREATRFADAWDQFHDEVAMDPRFTTGAKTAESERLEAALSAVASKVLGQKNKVSNAMFMHIPEHGFWHGPCNFGARMIIFFYFEDIDMGLAGIVRALNDTTIDFIRFSMVELGQGVMPTTKRGSA